MRATRLQDSIVASYLMTGLTPVQLGLFIRYQTSAERSFHKAHTALLKSQKQRESSKIGFESKKPEVVPEAPPNPEPKTPFPAPAEPQQPNIAQEIAWLMSDKPAQRRANNL